jgi:hypothetical protein
MVRELEVLKESPEGYIYEYYEEIKREMGSRRKILKNEIGLCSDRMIERIERTKTESFSLGQSECIQIHAHMKYINKDLKVYKQVNKLNQIRDRFDSLTINEAKLDKIKRVRIYF